MTPNRRWSPRIGVQPQSADGASSLRRLTLSPDVVAGAAVTLFFLVCLALARAHRIGGLSVENDFYGMYVPDAALIRRGLLPRASFAGPAYPALLALLGSLFHDDFAAAKAISVVSASLAAVGFYAAFRQVVSARVALGMLLFLLASSLFVQYAITASADMLALAFLAGALCFSFRPAGSRARNTFAAGALTGLAYLSRGNAIVLVPTFLAALFLVNPLRESVRGRLRAAAIYLAAIVVVVAPWSWICHRQTGAWLDNRNYINVAMEVNNLDSSGDDFVQIADRYHSMGDVLRENPARLVAHVARNAYQRVFQNLSWLVPFPLNQFVPAGLLMAVLALRRRRLAFAFYPAVFYLVLALVAARPRYYFFLLPYYLAAGVYFFTSLPSAFCLLPSAFCLLVPRLALTLCLLLTLWGSRQVMRSFLASEPRELGTAAARLREVDRPGERVMARTCHVGALAGLETEWLPNVPDMEALGRQLAAQHATYLVYGPVEQERRPQLRALRQPAQAPRWLRLVYVAPSGEVALYRTVPELLPRPRAGEHYVVPGPG